MLEDSWRLQKELNYLNLLKLWGIKRFKRIKYLNLLNLLKLWGIKRFKELNI